MYKKILVALENGRADEALVPHIAELARRLGSELLLLHVADGWAARYANALALRESEEIRDDRAYVERCRAELEADGLSAEAVLASGDPCAEIVAAAEREGADLIAMATHGHRFLNDLVRGSVANEVRHHTSLPVLMVRAAQPPA
jgi:nucleotide-binding universal stress UspA family protein